jgi:hypothetical protein
MNSIPDKIENVCKSCGHYELKKMVTSGQPYGYSGEIPCFTCSQYASLENKHTSV